MVDSKTKKTLIKIDPNYYRPNEIYNLEVIIQKQKNLGVEAQTSFDTMIKEMVYSDLKILNKLNFNFNK